MLDVAVVGAGHRGVTHLDTISRLQDLYRLVGVCDAREERRAWVAATYGVPVFDHPVALLEQARPQVVAVVVPPDAHHVITAAAAARGCHVLSETPIATTLGMANHMIESCRLAGVTLEVAENVWRFPAERLKRRAIDAGWIGEVAQVHLWYRSGSYHGMSALRRFLTTPPQRVLGFSREFPVAPFRELDGSEERRQTWELGVIEFQGAKTAVYQWPAGSDRGNLWEVVGSEGAIMGSDFVLFDGPEHTRRRLPIETITEDLPGGGKTLAALRLTARSGGPTVEWENPYRRYGLPAGGDDVARADIYAGMQERITTGRSRTPKAGSTGGVQRSNAQPIARRPEPAGQDGWPEPLPTESRFYGAANGRADQALLHALRESARRHNVWLDLPLPAGEPAALERELHREFEQVYGLPPFARPEALLGKLFPRRGVPQTLH